MKGHLLIALGLVLSHILVDFYLQPTSWVNAKQENKQNAWQLYVHALLSGILAIVCLWIFTDQWFWLLLPVVAIPHFFIDLWKLHFGRDIVGFILDQILHLSHLFVILAWLSKPIQMDQSLILKLAIVVIGGLFLIVPAGLIIGLLTKRFHSNLSTKDKKKALPEAGRWIGILERLFIFIAILVGQFGAIGFLIGAKSILRYTDSRSVENPIRMSEYVLIGSLLSFLFAMITALICEQLILLV